MGVVGSSRSGLSTCRPPRSQRRRTGSAPSKSAKDVPIGPPSPVGGDYALLPLGLALLSSHRTRRAFCPWGANVAHVDRGAGTSAPLPDESYLLTPAAEVRETNRLPGNAYLLTMLLLACSFGASVLRRLLTSAGRQGATCSWIGDDRAWLAVAHEEPSFLGVFRL